jgi:ERCC4-type nuclease
VPETLALSYKTSESLALHWLALTLTPGLGPTRARRLAEHFGGVQNIFKASLTELEAHGHPGDFGAIPGHWPIDGTSA